MDCCLAVAENEAVSRFPFGSKARLSPLDAKESQESRYPPKVKTTLMVVSTSTGSLFSRYGR
jgi:hypothetical protein